MIEKLIAAKHEPPEWATFIEHRIATGYGKGSETRFDALACNLYPSKGFFRVAYEVKRTRSDFLAELKDPGKRKAAETYCHETYFAVLPGVCEPEEVPDGWGLYVTSKDGEKLLRKKVARTREPQPLTEAMIAAVLRRANDQRVKLEAKLIVSLEGETVTHEDIEKLVNARMEPFMRERLEEKRQHAKALRALEDKRIALRAPYTELIRAAGEYDWQKDEAPTVDEVRRMLDKAVERRFASRVEHIRNAHAALSKLLEEK